MEKAIARTCCSHWPLTKSVTISLSFSRWSWGFDYYPCEDICRKQGSELRLRVCIALLIMSAFVGASVLRSNGLFVQDMWRLQEFLGGDGVTHLLMGGAFMMAGFLVVLPRSLFRTIRLALVVLLLLFLEEVSQLAMDTREFNWLDLGMGAAGAFLMMVILSSLHFLSLLFVETEINIEDDIQR